jgi:hypothetical protein
MTAETISVFFAGCASVFLGMSILYLTIRATAFFVNLLPVKDDGDES